MLETGTLIDGFRIERLIGRGGMAVVYEATQLSLDRRLALKVLHPELGEDPAFLERFRREGRLQAVLDHPHVVTVHEAGESEHGLFLAMRLVRGSSLAALLQEGSLDAARALKLLRQVAEALDAAHAAGLVHRDVKPRNVLVDADDRAYLADFGLTRTEEQATSGSDRDAFGAMLVECLPGALEEPAQRQESAAAIVDAAERALGQPVGRRRGRRLVVAGVAVAAAAAVTATIALVVAGREEAGSVESRAPPLLAGAKPLGSDLAPGAVRSVDCNGRPASGGSPDCTALQTRLSGRPLRVTRAGAIRRWAVRGARGELALQVLRRRDGHYVQLTRSQFETVPDQDVHAFATDLEVEPGEVVAILVTPGASFGVRRSPGAATSRWFGSLRELGYRVPTHEAGTGFDFEILLRVEYVPGARRRFPRQLTGARAAGAPQGRELRSKFLELSRSVVVRVALVKLPGHLVLDLFRGSRRAARIDVPGAESGGKLQLFAPAGAIDIAGGVAIPVGVRLEWLNPGGRVVGHLYAVGAGSFRFVS
jgi:tRNA A-37 threonylcarbamoyl transferase component Bud32